ncbi:NIPSNAP family protein [Variovorax sp. WS11]|uniref:NIPSNAP family protein n=1 Tax=Variovorax sp. WS11 TaxID=1105204 RepID=UPI0013DA2997|nr:NIPSNAP family protein [Variovorax sp. WS11]NDZ18145.1 NIPSNAP family protein [Variovorax sp. WS11]
MIYELRLYSVAPGRMADVHTRFNEHFPALFAKHGVDCVARWNAVAGPDAPRFVYLMAYRDYAHREAVWASFYADAQWWRIRAETNAGHEMVERHDLFFLKPNAAWPAASDAEAPVGGLHELVQQQIAPGQNANANVFLKETWLPSVREAGGRVLAVWDVASGAGMQKIVLLYAWPDAATWHAGRQAMDRSEALREAFAEQRRTHGTALFERAEVNLLDPAPGMTIRAGLGRGRA